MERVNMEAMMRKLIWLSYFLSSLAVAAPSHFPIVIGSALVCRDQVSSDYFNEHMQTVVSG